MAVQIRPNEMVDILGADQVANQGELHLSHVDVAATPYSANKYTMLLVTTGAGDVVVNLPVAATNAGKAYSIKKVDAGAGLVVVTPNAGAGDTIDGAASYSIRFQYDAILIVSDGGTGWWIT